MSSLSLASPSLLTAVAPAANKTLPRKILVAFAATMLLALASKIQVPAPVPFTMQSYIVLALGAILGFRMAAAVGALYIAEGLAGLPVFASGGGFAYIAMPSFGFLVGYLAAMAIVGYLTERGYGRNILSSIAVMFAGQIALYAFGLAWLAPVYGVQHALAIGFTPFVAADVAKTLLAAFTVAAAWKLTKHQG
jgi:biotin transport system substrate-specific component